MLAACRINEACTLAVLDVFGSNGVRGVLVLRSVNTKGKRDTREIQVHPKLRQYKVNIITRFLFWPSWQSTFIDYYKKSSRFKVRATIWRGKDVIDVSHRFGKAIGDC